MTQSIIEKLEALQLYWPGNRGEMYPAMTKEGTRPRYVGANDLRAIIEDAKAEKQEPVGDWLWGKLMCWCKSRGTSPANYNDLFAIVGEARNKFKSPHPDIVAELVKALDKCVRTMEHTLIQENQADWVYKDWDEALNTSNALLAKAKEMM